MIWKNFPIKEREILGAIDRDLAAGLPYDRDSCKPALVFSRFLLLHSYMQNIGLLEVRWNVMCHEFKKYYLLIPTAKLLQYKVFLGEMPRLERSHAFWISKVWF